MEDDLYSLRKIFRKQQELGSKEDYIV